jgi:hypothetical protein
MNNLQIEPSETKFYIQARLECEAVVEIFQRDALAPWEFIVTPKPGTKIEDFCEITGGKMHLSMIEGSAIGLLQLLHMCAQPKFSKRRKKLFGLF